MDNILTLSRNTNWGFNTKDTRLFTNSAFQLYNYVQRNSTKLLTDMKDKVDLQIVGMAFYYSARFIDYGDMDVNSVAAENAYYCLAKSVKQGNYFAAPKLYNLIKYNPNLLMSKFIATRMSEIQKTQKLPIGMIYGNPFNSKEAREESLKIILPLRIFIISKFYDIELNKTKMPKDMIEYSNEDIVSDLNEIIKYSSITEVLNIGEKYYEEVSNEIEDTLLKF
ncbi:MAG: hypothetical protein LBS20_04375 [Prevotella sp.]|jgi:hypothetical protein|nr:hypothetical protein [Prevotella sp.]